MGNTCTPVADSFWCKAKPIQYCKVQKKKKDKKKSITPFALSFIYGPTLTSLFDYWKNHRSLTIQIFVSKAMPLLFNIPSRFVITFLPRSKRLNFATAFTIHSDFGAQENKICHCYHFFPCCLPWCDGTACHELSVLNVEFQTTFSLSSFIFIRRLFCSSLLSVFFLS